MKRPWIIPAVIAVLLICCAGLLAAGLSGGLFYLVNLVPSGTKQPFVSGGPTGTPKIFRPEAAAPPENGTREAPVPVPEDTLQVLENTVVPVNDLRDLARRLAQMEKNYDAKFKIVFDAIRELMKPLEKPRRTIGFGPATKPSSGIHRR